MVILPHDGNHRQLSTYKEVKIKDLFKEVFQGAMIKVSKKPGNNTKMKSIANIERNLHMIRLPAQDAPSNAFKGYRKLKDFARKKDLMTGQYTGQIDKSRGADHAADALETLFNYLRVKEGQVNACLLYTSPSPRD